VGIKEDEGSRANTPVSKGSYSHVFVQIFLDNKQQACPSWDSVPYGTLVRLRTAVGPKTGFRPGPLSRLRSRGKDPKGVHQGPTLASCETKS
jgi:hypothetical protein